MRPHALHPGAIQGKEGIKFCHLATLDLDPVLLAGDVQRREAVERARVRVGLAVEQQLGHPHVPAVRRHVEGGQVVDGDLVDGGLVVQQDPRGVDVVALSGNSVEIVFESFC